MSAPLPDERRLDPEIKANWLAALRGGNYCQTTGQLRREDEDGVSHCCLGVLGEVCGIPFVPGNGYLWEDGEQGQLLDFEEQDKLADMNDGGKSFTEIADYIEANL